MVVVVEHMRDGSKVRAHNRDWPGARKELGVLAAVAIAVFALSGSGGSAAGGQSGAAQPRPAADLPLKSGTGKAPVVRIVLPAGTPANQAWEAR